MNEFLTILGNLAGGFGTASQPFNLLMLLFGVLLGLVIGVLPGLGGTSGVAILLPVTVRIAASGPGGATSAVILLAGVYWGALFGGVISSILFNIPGEPWSVVLLFDGFPLAKRKGKPGLALTSSFLASFVGAFIATVLFTFLANWIADRALAFGPPELFAVFVLSFTTLIGLGAESPLKAVAMLAFGLLLAAVGFDTLTGSQRLNFGSINLLAGIGFVSGVPPVHGATPASFLGYGLARQYAKDKSGFGKGEISGIMGPQATADAGGVASLVPMITLGVPGSPPSAVVLGRLFVGGVHPGPPPL